MQNQLSEKTSHHIEEVLKAGKNLHVIKIYSLYGDYARFDDLCLGLFGITKHIADKYIRYYLDEARRLGE